MVDVIVYLTIGWIFCAFFVGLPMANESLRICKKPRYSGFAQILFPATIPEWGGKKKIDGEDVKFMPFLNEDVLEDIYNNRYGGTEIAKYKIYTMIFCTVRITYIAIAILSAIAYFITDIIVDGLAKTAVTFDGFKKVK